MSSRLSLHEQHLRETDSYPFHKGRRLTISRSDWELIERKCNGRYAEYTARFAKKLRERDETPYGKWTCQDGREVLFNRDYEPIWQRLNGEAPAPANRRERVKGIVREGWYFSDENPPWSTSNKVAAKATRERCDAVLRAWGVGRSDQPHAAIPRPAEPEAVTSEQQRMRGINCGCTESRRLHQSHRPAHQARNNP